MSAGRGLGIAADCAPKVPECRPLPHWSCLGSPRREKSEDAYVQGDSAGAPSDLRLSRLSNILPGGEMWEKVGLRGLFLPSGTWAYFVRSRILSSTLPVCRREPQGQIGATLLGVGILGHLEPPPLWALPLLKSEEQPRVRRFLPGECLPTDLGTLPITSLAQLGRGAGPRVMLFWGVTTLAGPHVCPGVWM